jgi:hypothetical protein
VVDVGEKETIDSGREGEREREDRDRERMSECEREGRERKSGGIDKESLSV